MTAAGVGIVGVGTALPDASATQDQYAKLICRMLALSDDDSRFVQLISERSGIERRYTIALGTGGHSKATPSLRLYELGDNGQPLSTGERMRTYAAHAPKLAEEAARRALADAAPPDCGDPRGVTHLVTFSCTGFGAPGVDIELIRRLGLSPNVERVHVGFMGCHAAINALRVAQALVMSSHGARVLVVGVELCSLHFIRTNRRDQLIAGCLFGDGAAAALLTSSCDAKLRLIDTASVLLPQSMDAMGWSIGDAGFEMSLAQDVPDLIASHVRASLDLCCKKIGKSTDELRDHALWCVHPGGPRVLDSISKSLNLSRNSLRTSREILRRFGNLSSVTTLFILDRLRHQYDSDGSRRSVIALAFGPGLCCEVALLELGSLLNAP